MEQHLNLSTPNITQPVLSRRISSLPRGHYHERDDNDIRHSPANVDEAPNRVRSTTGAEVEGNTPSAPQGHARVMSFIGSLEEH